MTFFPDAKDMDLASFMTKIRACNQFSDRRIGSGQSFQRRFDFDHVQISHLFIPSVLDLEGPVPSPRTDSHLPPPSVARARLPLRSRQREWKRDWLSAPLELPEVAFRERTHLRQTSHLSIWEWHDIRDLAGFRR